MKVSEAKEKVCPFIYNVQSSALGESEGMHINCITSDCMAWKATIDGKKEIDRQQIPYDTYPMEEGNIHRQLIKDGYIELDRSKGRNVYVKYEECYEGYCKRLTNE